MADVNLGTIFLKYLSLSGKINMSPLTWIIKKSSRVFYWILFFFLICTLTLRPILACTLFCCLEIFMFSVRQYIKMSQIWNRGACDTIDDVMKIQVPDTTFWADSPTPGTPPILPSVLEPSSHRGLFDWQKVTCSFIHYATYHPKIILAKLDHASSVSAFS